MITFPTSVDQAIAAEGTFRAGATDLQERRQHRIATGPVVDLRDLPDLDRIERRGDGLLIGALVPISVLAEHEAVAKGWPGLAQAAGGLATPQIRNRATVGGNLLQTVRCWYYRSPRFTCLKKGGATCLARAGDHLYHSCFDKGACAAPHPSTLAMAFLAWDAAVLVKGGKDRTRAELVGDGSDPRRNHTLEDKALLTHVVLPTAPAGEQSAYVRTIARARAEWPLVEAVAAVHVSGGTIRSARVAIGGVANIPLRLPKVEAALVGKAPDPLVLDAAVALGADGAQPLPMTGYKVGLIGPTLRDALDRALAG